MPSSTPELNLPSRPLPANVAGIPEAGAQTAMIEPHTPAGSVPVGVEQTYTLGHCGLYSPIDLDGSLWDPIYGEQGSGGLLTEPQLGELINSTPVVLVLSDHETALFVTPLGARILLTRHSGPRPYNLCL